MYEAPLIAAEMREREHCGPCRWWAARRAAGEPPAPESRFREVFRLALIQWDIDAARELVTGRAPEEWATLELLRNVGIVAVDSKHARHVPLVEPVIVGWLPGEYSVPGEPIPFPLDGWHRLYQRGRLLFVRTPVLLLTQAESAACRLPDWRP